MLYKFIPSKGHAAQPPEQVMGYCIAKRMQSKNCWSLWGPPVQDGYTLAVIASKLEVRWQSDLSSAPPGLWRRTVTQREDIRMTDHHTCCTASNIPLTARENSTVKTQSIHLFLWNSYLTLVEWGCPRKASSVCWRGGTSGCAHISWATVSPRPF